MEKSKDSFKKGMLCFGVIAIVRSIQILINFTILSRWLKYTSRGFKDIFISFPPIDISIEFLLYIIFFVISIGIIRGLERFRKILLIDIFLVIIFHIVRIGVFFYRKGNLFFNDIGLLCLFILSAYVCFREFIVGGKRKS